MAVQIFQSQALFDFLGALFEACPGWTFVFNFSDDGKTVFLVQKPLSRGLGYVCRITQRTGGPEGTTKSQL